MGERGMLGCDVGLAGAVPSVALSTPSARRFANRATEGTLAPLANVMGPRQEVNAGDSRDRMFG